MHQAQTAIENVGRLAFEHVEGSGTLGVGDGDGLVRGLLGGLGNKQSVQGLCIVVFGSTKSFLCLVVDESEFSSFGVGIFKSALGGKESRVGNVEVGLSIIVVLVSELKSILSVGGLGLGIEKSVVGIIEHGLGVLEVVPGDVMGILGSEVSAGSSVKVSLSLMKIVSGLDLGSSGSLESGISSVPDSLGSSKLFPGDSKDLLSLGMGGLGNFEEVLSGVVNSLSLVFFIFSVVEDILCLGKGHLSSLLLVDGEVD